MPGTPACATCALTAVDVVGGACAMSHRLHVEPVLLGGRAAPGPTPAPSPRPTSPSSRRPRLSATTRTDSAFDARALAGREVLRRRRRQRARPRSVAAAATSADEKSDPSLTPSCTCVHRPQNAGLVVRERQLRPVYQTLRHVLRRAYAQADAGAAASADASANARALAETDIAADTVAVRGTDARALD